MNASVESVVSVVSEVSVESVESVVSVVQIASVDRCKRLVGQIQNLASTEIEELFKILHESNCKYTINNNGVFINMSRLDEKTLDKIEQFIQFCSHSSGVLEKYENICNELNEGLISARTNTINQQQSKYQREKALREKPVIQTASAEDGRAEQDAESETASNLNVATATVKAVSKITSSMRFYLLKKRFSKGVGKETGLVNDLETEDYILKK